MNEAVAKGCVVDLLDKIGSVIGKSNVYHVYSEAELEDAVKGTKKQYACVMYTGMRGTRGYRNDEGRGGAKALSAELNCTVMVFFRGSTSAKLDPKITNVLLIDQIRAAINGTRSPTGHWWRFQVEASIPSKQGLLVYLQQWSTAVQLTT